MVTEGSRTSDGELEDKLSIHIMDYTFMDSTFKGLKGLKVENGLGLRSFPDDSAFLEVRAGELALEENPTHFFSMSGVLHASGR